LAFTGLCVPALIRYLLISKTPGLMNDVLERFFNFGQTRLRYWLLACLIMPISIMMAQGISLSFGYSPSQFVITDEFTFSSGIFPVGFLLIIAPLIEELAWHSYDTDCLRRKYTLFKTSLIFGVFWGAAYLACNDQRRRSKQCCRNGMDI